MVVDMGKTIATATCRNCRGGIHRVQWSLRGPEWVHDDNDDVHCPSTPTAEPAPGTVSAVTDG